METGKAGEAKNGDGKSWAAKAGMSEMPEMGGEVGVRARLLLAIILARKMRCCCRSSAPAPRS
jgi:hypothetical protein